MSWAEARARFPVLVRHAYLNAGTFGPLSRATADAMAELERWETENGRGGLAYFMKMLGLRDRLRALLAEQIAVAPDRLALTESTTQGVHIVVAGLGLGPGDEVVTTDLEHFGLTGPLVASGASVHVVRLRAPKSDRGHGSGTGATRRPKVTSPAASVTPARINPRPPTSADVSGSPSSVTP